MGEFKIGKQLRTLRESCQMTTNDVAQKIGISRATYALWETDKYAPAIPTLPALANAFDLTVVELMAKLIGLSMTPEEKLDQRLKRLAERSDDLHERLEKATYEQNLLIMDIEQLRRDTKT